MDHFADFACPSCDAGTLELRASTQPHPQSAATAGAIAFWHCDHCTTAAVSSTDPATASADGAPTGYIVRASAIGRVHDAVRGGNFLIASAAYDMWAHPMAQFPMRRRTR